MKIDRPTSNPQRAGLSLVSFLCIATILAVLCTHAAAQSKTTDGGTPLGLQAGGPSGSYSLSGFDNVSLYNGALNFSLPLVGIGGRGGAGHTIVLPIERRWMTEYWQDLDNNTFIYPIDKREEAVEPGYGPGVMTARFVGAASISCPAQNPPCEECPTKHYYNTLTRLSFTGPDGSEILFVDVQTGGLAHANPGTSQCSTGVGYNRGKVFTSRDGSGATFISATDISDYILIGQSLPEYMVSGTMILRDGTRYEISNGLVTSIRDRNGNLITFTYSNDRVTAIKDSLNRQVTIDYDVNEGGSYGVCDKITYKGFGGATRLIRVSKTTLGNVLRSGYSLHTTSYLFPELSANSYSNYNPTVVSSVWLPDSDSVTRRYQFQYNSYGELARVILPTGGAYEYDYGVGTTNGNSSGTVGAEGAYQIYRRIVERRVYADGTNLSSKTMFSVPESESSGTFSTAGYVSVEQRDAGNTLFTKSKSYFNGPGAVSSLWSDPASALSLPSQTDGKEYKSEALDSNGSTVLRRVEHTWNTASSSYLGQGPYISQTVTTLEPSGANLVAKQTFSWDRYNNQTDVYEYDYGSGSAGSLVRHTATSYITTNNSYDYACDPASTCDTSASLSNVIHIRSLPSQVSVYDSGSTERARTTFEYDNYASDSKHAGLVSRSSISGLDSAFTTSLTTRGNATGTTRSFLNSSGSVTGSISAYAQYDIAGNVVKTIDARGYVTAFDFDDCFGAPDNNARTNTSPTELSTPGQSSFAFATKVTNALNQSAYVQFDYYLGKPVNAEDANGIVAGGYYDDVLDRPTQVKRAVGISGLENQTTFAYDDASRTVTTTSDQDSTHTLTSKALYDQLGRTTESRQYETSSNYIVTKRDYDAIGRAYRISNPYRPWNSESAAWTTSVYDALGRTVTTTSPDSAVVSTSYSGNTVTATDQASKSRKSVSDALGRLTSVYEDPSGSNYQTSYTYSALNDLTQVSQGSQTRTFEYDSLKRLTSAANPESGTETYTYDNNGNLLVKTDARGVSTHVSYDELNRPTRRWYNGSSSTSSTTNNSPSLPSGVASTDEVAFYYDSQTLPSGAPSYTRGYSTGALVAVTYGGGSEGTYRGYDELGRVVRQYQRTDSVNYLVEASFNIDSSVGSETYPSVPGASDRRSVSFSYDGAGRLSSLSSSATSYAPAASVSSIGYASQNALSTETYGNSLIHAISYNSRQQPTEIKLGTSSNSTSVLDLTYSYGSSNNGNITSLSYSGGGLSYTQSFSYDSLNRLSSATETNGGNTNWSQTNAYDRYGNRQIDYGGGSYNLAFSSTTNKITTSGFTYDSSGNLTNDGNHSYGFDGDGKVKSVDSTTAYTYDGEGKRVRKLVGENTRFIYGIGGQVIAEYDGSSGNLKKEYVAGGGGMITIEPTAVNSNGAQYATGDHLGSPRVITNSSGSVVSRHDYMPFGEELAAGTGGRTTGMGFSNSGDNNRKKFTGYERDTETGLDFAQARFYGSTQGRFTSPDPFSASAIIADAQTFNRYGYCRNNPVNSVDPSGMSAYAAMQNQGAQERREASWQDGHYVIEASEKAYEQGLNDVSLAVQMNAILTAMINGAGGESATTSNSGGAEASSGEEPQQNPAEPQQQPEERNKADIQIDTITYLPTPNGLKIRLLATVKDSR